MKEYTAKGVTDWGSAIDRRITGPEKYRRSRKAQKMLRAVEGASEYRANKYFRAIRKNIKNGEER